MRSGQRLLISVAAIAACAITFGQVPLARAGADTIMVTTTDDELNADGDCSLREAVMAVNTEAPVDGCPGAVGNRHISLEPIEYRLTIPGADEDAGLTGDLDVHRPISIESPAAGMPTIDGGALDRVLDIHPSAYPLSSHLVGLALRNGDAGDQDGGAIRISDVPCDGSVGTQRGVELFSVTIEGSRATRGGGVHIGTCNDVEFIGSSIVRNAADDVGGGVSIIGDSILGFDTSTISTNRAHVAGGGVWAGLTEASFGWGLALTTVSANVAPDGGGFWSQTPVQMNTPIVASNAGGNCGGPGGTYGGGISDDDTCGSDGLDTVNLLPLATVNGMPVHALGQGSPAIEAAGEPAPNGWCSTYLISDQVGTIRPLDGDGDGVAACDAGAIEAAAVPVTGPSPTPTPLPDTAVVSASEPGIVPVALAALAAISAVAGWRLGWRRAPRQ